MDELTKHRKDRLRALIDGKPYAGNQAEFGRKAGLTKARITQLLNPDEPFGERAAESLCAKLELSPRWFEQGLSTGECEMVLAGGALPGQAVRAHDAGEPLSDAYIQIPENAVRFAAGNGRTALFDEVADSVPRTYRRDWFIKEGINPQQARCFKVDGDSMEELLFDGDSVLVNLAETQILNGKVYALRYGDELRIKRVYRKLDGSLILHSDNPAFVPREEEIPAAAVEQHIGIIGRVRDKSGRGGL